MSKRGRTHEENFKLVCAVCTNLRGKKASRGVSDEEEKDIQKVVFKSYNKCSIYFLQGLCNTCAVYLCKLRGTTEEQGPILLLPDNYHCTLPHETRSKSKVYCECRWCRIARMNGLEVRRFQQEVKVGRKGKEEISEKCAPAASQRREGS